MAVAGKMGSHPRPGTEKYSRGYNKEQRRAHYSKDKKLNAGLKKLDQQHKEAMRSAAGTELLLQEEVGFLEADGPMEKTFKFKQDEITEVLDESTVNKKFELKLASTTRPLHRRLHEEWQRLVDRWKERSYSLF